MNGKDWLYAILVFTVALALLTWRVSDEFRVKLGRDTVSHVGYNIP